MYNQDEDDEVVYTIRPARHDRFSILVPALQAAANTAAGLYRMFNTYSMMALQQSMMIEYDREFNRITENLIGGEE